MADEWHIPFNQCFVVVVFSSKFYTYMYDMGVLLKIGVRQFPIGKFSHLK